MTNAILRGMTHAGNSHGRVDDGETASAKPRRGSLLRKLKTPVAVLAGALVSLAHGAVSITSPVDYATVTVMPSVMRDFRSTFATGKKWSLVNSSTLGSAQRIEWETACRASQTAVALSWSGTGSTMCTVKVYRAKDGAEVFSATSTTGKASFPDAEIGRNYRWTVTYNSATTEGHFYVNRIAPRMMNSFGGIGNSRDLGGWTTDSGKVVRQGLVFRSEEWDFVDSATGLYRDGCEPKPYWADTVGVNLDIDLRAKECVNSYYMPANDSRAALDKSPLDLDKNIRRFRTEDAGTSVGAFPGAAGFNAGGEVGGDPTVYTADQFKRAIAYAVHQFGNRDNYPILFHCSQGTDRTGALAYLLSGLLGVSEDDRDLDFVFSYAWDADEYKLLMWDMDTIRDTVNKCSGATFKDKCVTYVKNCYAMTTSPKLSATDAENDIATFRSMMLEDPEEAATVPSGDEESFVYENYYWMRDGAGGTLSDGMSYWYKDPEGETKWPADQQNIVNNPNAAVYLWPTAAHPYAYPVAEAFTIGKLVSRISYGGTVGLVPGEPTTYEPNPSPKGYFTNNGHGVTDRPLWTHQSGVASAERLRMYLEAGTGTGSVQIWTNARLNLSAFKSVYENVYIDFPAGKCDGATVCFYGLNGSQGESTVAWIQGGQDGTAQNLIVSNALLTVQRADKTSGVAGALNLEFDLGAANETTGTMMTVNGGFKMNAGSTIRVNAGGKPAGTYRLLTVGSGKTLTIPTATVSGAKVVGCAPGLAGTVALSGNVLSVTIVKTTTTVTLGDHPHLTVAWTSGDGSVTNSVDGTDFSVAKGATNVKVFFTAESGWEIVGNAVVELGTVTENVVFGAEGDYMVPEVAITDLCLIAFGRGSSNMAVAWTSGDGSVTNAVANKVKAMYVPRGSENVRIICTANPGYELVGESVFDLGTVTDNFTFGQGNGFVFPIAYDIAANVVYLDWDEANGRMTNAVARAGYWRSVEDSEMACAMKGCMVVTNDVTIPIAQVAGATVLVLCNDATLTVTGADDCAGIFVPGDASLTITVRKGSTGRVVAQGGTNCAGVGSQFKQGSGSVLGAVRIVAGTVTATGGRNAAGIGNGLAGHGGGVKIFGGAVTAVAEASGASDIGDGADPYSSCAVSISGGVFARSVQDAWCADRFAVFANPDPATKGAYPYAVLPACRVTIGKCPIHVSAAWTSDDGSVTNAIEGESVVMPDGTPNVRVVFTADDGYALDCDAAVDLGAVTEDIVFGVGNDYRVPHAVPVGAIDYLDWDAVNGTLTNATVAAGEWTLVTEATRTLGDGWYVVAYEVVLPEGSNIVVNGSAHLILCDGALLSVTGGYDQAAIEVTRTDAVTNSLAIYAQTEGTGRLTAQGGEAGAGIGGGNLADGGKVTICGGRVTAKGGMDGSDIGGVQSGAADEIAISGGVFGMPIPDAWCVESRGAFANPDPATSADYPYAVLPAYKVTIGDYPHMTARWTSGDGLVTNEVEGASFRVQVWEGDVRVIFAVDDGYVLAGESEVHLGAVRRDITFGDGNDFKVPYATFVGDTDHRYCVIDLSEGPGAAHYPVSFLDDEPAYGWPDEYRTDKLVLRRIDPGTFLMGDQAHGGEPAVRTVTLAQPYFVGVFEVTQRQWELVMGTRPSYFTNETWYATRPVESVSYSGIRGAGADPGQSPETPAGEGSFLCALLTKTGIAFDLPTEAQWEYAARSGTTTDYGNGTNYRDADSAEDANMDSVGRYVNNSGATTNAESDVSAMVAPSNGTATVGSYAPNGWGLYDLHGNVGEICRDLNDDGYLIARGCGWRGKAPQCASSYRISVNPHVAFPDYGFRIVWSLPAVEDLCGLSFDANGGSCAVSTQTVANGSSPLSLPGATKEGHCLDGWYTDPTKGEKVTSGTTVLVNQTLYAHWAEIPPQTENVMYLDYDASTGTFTNAVRECELLSNGLETRPYSNGWYYVRGEFTIPAGRRFEVAETNTVHLILCDGARLRIRNQGDGLAAVKTTGGTLVIYGQEAGTGMIVAEGGGEDANLPSGAGIGGDNNCPGGTVTINGGTVIAQGGKGAAGIGGGNGGSGGTVTINGGKVMAKGGTGAEDIGHGAHASGSGTLSMSGGLFWEEPKDDRIAQGRSKALNLDWATKADYPWAVGVARTVTIGDFPHGTIAWTADEWTVTNAVEGGAFTVLGGTENVKVIFTADPGYELVGAAVVDLGTVTADIAFGGGSDYRVPLVRNDIHYLDWDEANGRMTNAVAQGGAWTAVSESTQVLKGCAVVTNDVTVPFLDVSGATCLILCNDATLTVTGADGHAGIHVPSDASLTITVQKGSSGQVVAQGGANYAGIGSQFANGECSDLGTVKIVAGTVKATGGVNAAGIGNGNGCGGGGVKIFGGKVTAVAGSESASDIGAGASATSSCEVSISGGFFARKPQEAWLESGFEAISNMDEPTRIGYPWAIVRSGWKDVLVDYDSQSVRISSAWVVLRSGDAEVYSKEVDLDDAEDEEGRLRVWVPNEGVIIVDVIYTDKFGGMHLVSRELGVDTSAPLYLDKAVLFEAESVDGSNVMLYRTLAEAVQSGVGPITLIRDVNDATGNYHIPRGEDDGSGQTREHKVVIDLNGFTVNGLGKAPLFVNEGTLTIRDSSAAGTGRLTNYSDDKQIECGGCVLNYGVFTLESGVIEKCSAKHFGGGIMGMADSETYIRGGEIRLCEANEGSAVYSRGRFEMTGGAVHETMKLFQRQLLINGYDYRVAISGGLLGCALDDLSCLAPTAELLENTDSNTRSDYPYCIVDPMVQEAIYEVVNVDQAYFATHSTILEANRIYRFVKDVSLAGSTSDPALASALSVTNGTVVLYLNAGVTVSLTGAVADGRSGAGLRVPRTATVVITGEGTLIAQGGERGGTGAAAAIGGCGGLGGADASSGEDMGLVFTMGQVKIKATSCLATEKGGSGGLPTCAIGGGGGVGGNGGMGHVYVGEEVKVECGGIDWTNFVIQSHYGHGALCRQIIILDEKDIEVCCVEACLNEPLPEITWALLGPKENIRGLFLANGDDSADALWYDGDPSPRKPRYETDDLGDVRLQVRYGKVVAILDKDTENERKFETLAAAVDEANYGDTISIVGDVRGENVKVPIGLTIEVESETNNFREPKEVDLRHKYYLVTTRGEGGKTYYTYGLNEEMVVPRFGSSDGTPAMEFVRDEEGKTVSVRLNVLNVYEDLYYTIYWGLSPHPGEMVPVTWECADKDGTIRLQAPADDESGFYQIRVTDHLEWLYW